MTDFASAAMMRVLAHGMRELGLDPGGLSHNPSLARVDLRLKQDLVRSAVIQGGLGCLPLLGRGLHRLTHEPTHQALSAARGERDLFERWQRLERYVHSRHRCVLETCSLGEARILHVALGSGPAPSAAEDLVIAGVLAALLEAIGLQRVCVWLGGVMAYPNPDSLGIERSASQGSTSHWHFCWEGDATRGEVDPFHARVRQLGADRAWPETAQRAYLKLVDDLTRPLPLRELTGEVAMPWRTLQRRLSEAGLSYSLLLAEARRRTGAWRLLHTVDPIAEVGFLSGFSDQPHFTREMQRRVGMPPAAYRASFMMNAQPASRPG